MKNKQPSVRLFALSPFTLPTNLFLAKISRASKVFFSASVVAAAATIFAVHYLQIQEREVRSSPSPLPSPL